MPTASRAATSAERKRASTKSQNAVELLKADHRQVEDWFEQFKKSRSDGKKQELADKICAALKAHTAIEEEIFYPAFLEATGEDEMHDEAIVEHEGAKRLISEIESGSPGDELWEAKVKVLAEQIKHHVKEEEKRDGMFAMAKKADMDLDMLGEEMAARKQEVMKKDGRPRRM